MDQAQPTPGPAQPFPGLTRDIFYLVIQALRVAMPSPATDDPEDQARRDRGAIAQVASLRPANADEGILAAEYVAAHFQALDCLRLAHEQPSNASVFLQCSAQASSMMNRAMRSRTLLRQAQSERENREAETVARQAEAEQRIAAVLADAMRDAPPIVRPARVAPPQAGAEPQPAQSAPPMDALAEAERYAQLHRKRAVLIRRLRRLPDKLNVGWLRPEVVQAIITGTTPALSALDDKPVGYARAAA